MSAHATHATYWVYFLANKPHGTLYIGVTNSLERRLWQHRYVESASFVRRYGIFRLVYFEEFRAPANAIAREKQLKGWLRVKKIALIERDNPLWRDLADGWFDQPGGSAISR